MPGHTLSVSSLSSTGCRHENTEGVTELQDWEGRLGLITSLGTDGQGEILVGDRAGRCLALVTLSSVKRSFAVLAALVLGATTLTSVFTAEVGC